MQPTEQGRFHRAIVEAAEPNKGHPQYELWLNYALSTNERGRYLVETLLDIIPSLQDKQLLDIGSGYGGTCLAAAGVGARATGIDIDPTLIRFAELNRQDHPDLAVTFHQMDILDWERVRGLGSFDAITCDNVIEHVARPERLVAHIRELLAPGGFAYLTIPNAFSVGQIRADCHYGLFGISLLDPWDATEYVRHALDQPSYDVSMYYPYPVYADMFARYGLEVRLLNPLKGTPEKLNDEVARLREELQTALASGRVPAGQQERMAAALDAHLGGLETALAHQARLARGPERERLRARLVRDYLEEVWYVVATPDWRAVRARSPRLFLRRLLRRARRVARRALGRA